MGIEIMYILHNIILKLTYTIIFLKSSQKERIGNAYGLLRERTIV